jgi:hypothetical protein
MGGPPRPLRGPSLRITTAASWAPHLPCCSTSTTLPHHRGRRRTREGWCITSATGAARATSCLTLPSWQHTPPRMPARAARGPRGLLAPPRLKRLKPSPRCFDHIHNHLDNPARNTHSPMNARGRQWCQWIGWKTMAGTIWLQFRHTPVILSTILIHVGSPRVHVCNALGRPGQCHGIPQTYRLHY